MWYLDVLKYAAAILTLGPCIVFVWSLYHTKKLADDKKFVLETLSDILNAIGKTMLEIEGSRKKHDA